MALLESDLAPPDNSECLICYDDVSIENFLLYSISAVSKWYPAKFCLGCIEEYKKTQFHRYVDSLANSNCAKEQRALLDRGPPINLFDKEGFPEAGNSEIHSLYYPYEKKEMSAKLEGSLVGEERMRYWNEQKSFLIKNESNEEETNGEKVLDLTSA